MNDDEPSFSSDEASQAQEALRRELGLGPESFPLPAFVGMLSDEIEQMRATGRSDTVIAALLTGITGKTVTAEQIGRYYAPPEERGHFGGEGR